MKITRLLTLIGCLFISACNSSALQLAEGGIGGTGIATGPITAFGSVFVNGVEYNVDQAVFTRNGQEVVSQQDYHLGEYVTVKGQVNADGITGTATELSFTNALNGIVTAASFDGTSITVMQQPVYTTGLTVLHGFATLTDLSVGNVVEVSGLRDAQGRLIATSITLKQTNYVAGETLKTQGMIQQLDSINQTFKIGNLTIGYAQAVLSEFGAQTLANGLYVDVKSSLLPQNNQFIAETIELEHEHVSLSNGVKVELAGVVTRFTNTYDFAVNGQAVLANATTEISDGVAADIALNTWVEVEGTVDNQGNLIAKEIAIRQSTHTANQEFENTIAALDSVNRTFDLDGKRFSVNASTLWEDDSVFKVHNMNFDQLVLGDYLDVTARPLTNGQWLALRIKRETAD